MFVVQGERAHVMIGRMDKLTTCGEPVSFDAMFAESRLSNMIVCGGCTGEPEVRRVVVERPIATKLPPTTEVRSRGRQPGSKRCPGCGKIRVLNARGNCGAC